MSIINQQARQEKSVCVTCGKKLTAQETDDYILLACTNGDCSNCWVAEGAEIALILK